MYLLSRYFLACYEEQCAQQGHRQQRGHGAAVVAAGCAGASAAAAFAAGVGSGYAFNTSSGNAETVVRAFGSDADTHTDTYSYPDADSGAVK